MLATKAMPIVNRVNTGLCMGLLMLCCRLNHANTLPLLQLLCSLFSHTHTWLTWPD